MARCNNRQASIATLSVETPRSLIGAFFLNPNAIAYLESGMGFVAEVWLAVTSDTWS